MQSDYHQTHYRFFYVVLPHMLRSFMFDEILRAFDGGTGNGFLVGFWRTTVRQVCEIPMGVTLPDGMDLTRDDFSAKVFRKVNGFTYLSMMGPEPGGPVEARCAMAVFDDSRPTETLRYFTCEAPTFSGLPWMVGEWFEDGGRANLGEISDASEPGLFDFVSRYFTR